MPSRTTLPSLEKCIDVQLLVLFAFLLGGLLAPLLWPFVMLLPLLPNPAKRASAARKSNVANGGRSYWRRSYNRMDCVGGEAIAKTDADGS